MSINEPLPTPISRLLGEPARLIEAIAEHLPWAFPPEEIAFVAEVEETGGLGGEWLAQMTLREYLDDRSDAISTWVLRVGHDDRGVPVDARLTRGPLEVPHDGWSKVCPECRDGEPVVDVEEDGMHYSLRRAGNEGASVDPAALVEALARSHNAASPTEYHDPALAMVTWQEAVAALIAKRRRVPPRDLLPLVADGTIPVHWSASWLRRPGVLVPEKVRIECQPGGIADAVKCVFHGLLDEGNGEGHSIADDLADALGRYYCRPFAVTVWDDETGVRGASGGHALIAPAVPATTAPGDLWREGLRLLRLTGRL